MPQGLGRPELNFQAVGAGGGGRMIGPGGHQGQGLGQGSGNGVGYGCQIGRHGGLMIGAIVAAVSAATVRAAELPAAELPAAELRAAELMYIEKRFRIRRPIHLVAQLDRAYRAPDGALVLVELKTRWGGPQLSDIIQMSAQRMVVEGETGQPVAKHGIVMIERPDAQRSLRSHRIQLWDAAQVWNWRTVVKRF